jgi:hypothetical protein
VVADPAELFTKTVHFNDVLWRNIKGVRISQNVFDDLSDDAEEHVYAVSAERLTKPPSEASLLSGPFDYAQSILFPFDGENWHATRYSDGTEFGVWYGSDSLETTIWESTHHWIRFLCDTPTRDAGESVLGERRVFTAGCCGLLADLREKHELEPRLIHPSDYSFTHDVGRYASRQGLNGMLVPSAQHIDGFNGAILERRLLSNPRDRCYLTYKWAVGASEIRVERKPGIAWLRIPIPEQEG